MYTNKKRILIVSCNPEELLKFEFRKTPESGSYTLDVRKSDTAVGALENRDYAAVLCFDETIDRRSAIIDDSIIRFSNRRIPFIMTSGKPTNLEGQDLAREYRPLAQIEKTLSEKLEIVNLIVRRLEQANGHSVVARPLQQRPF